MCHNKKNQRFSLPTLNHMVTDIVPYAVTVAVAVSLYVGTLLTVRRRRFMDDPRDATTITGQSIRTNLSTCILTTSIDNRVSLTSLATFAQSDDFNLQKK
jgi:hypothetical protein